MFVVRSIVTFFISTVAFMFLMLANLSGANAPFVRNLYLSKAQDEYSQYIWTLYNFCSYDGKELTGTGTCSDRKAAYPYEPYEWSSGFKKHSTYKNGSKAAYAFILIALLVTIAANIVAIAAFVKRSTRLFNVYRYATIGSLILILLGAMLDTALHRYGVKRIQSDGVYTAQLGKTMIAFLWLPVVLLAAAVFISFFWRAESPRAQEMDPEKTRVGDNYDPNPFKNEREYL